MKKELFDFQKTTVDKVVELQSHGERTTLLISLMGTGKTVMAAWLIEQMFLKGKRCMFLVDLDCLVKQICTELTEWGMPFTLLKGKSKYDSTLPIVVASAQTIDSRKKKGATFQDYLCNFDLIIMDEAHNLSYRAIAIDIRNHYLENSDAKILGLTATPWRLNKKQYLGQYYNSVVVGLQPPELIRIGRAVPCRIFNFDDYFDLDEIALGDDGDYLDTDMEKQSISIKQLHRVYGEWKALTPNHSTIAFCSTVAHAKALAEYFTSEGVSAAYITGNTPTEEREALFKKLGQAYRKLTKEWHPDIHSGASKIAIATAKMQEINGAYDDYIKDLELRA